MTKQITPAHVRRALEQERLGTATRSPPHSALKQILAKLPAKGVEFRLRPRRAR